MGVLILLMVKDSKPLKSYFFTAVESVIDVGKSTSVEWISVQ